MLDAHDADGNSRAGISVGQGGGSATLAEIILTLVHGESAADDGLDKSGQQPGSRGIQ